MKTVYKYKVWSVRRETVVEMPVGARIVNTGIQREDFVFWAEVDCDQSETERRIFIIITTGGSVVNSAVYVGSIIDNDGELDSACYVWHLFELTETLNG